MKLLFVGDTHFSDTSPSSRIDDYTASGMMKLVNVIEHAESQAVDAVIFLGDLFHSKIYRNISHRLVNSINSILRTSSIPRFSIIGNHDFTGTGDISHTPLASLDLNILHEAQDFMGFTLLPVHGNIPVTAEYLFDLSLHHEKPNVIMLVHQQIHVSTQLFDCILLDELPSNPLAIIYGDAHAPFGPYLRSGQLIANPGALLRTSRTFSDCTPQVLVIDFPSLAYEVLPIIHNEKQLAFQQDPSPEQNEDESLNFINALNNAEPSLDIRSLLINRIRQIEHPAAKVAEDLINAI